MATNESLASPNQPNGAPGAGGVEGHGSMALGLTAGFLGAAASHVARHVRTYDVARRSLSPR
jgi:hypothetical protein